MGVVDEDAQPFRRRRVSGSHSRVTVHMVELESLRVGVVEASCVASRLSYEGMLVREKGRHGDAIVGTVLICPEVAGFHLEGVLSQYQPEWGVRCG